MKRFSIMIMFTFIVVLTMAVSSVNALGEPASANEIVEQAPNVDAVRNATGVRVRVEASKESEENTMTLMGGTKTVWVQLVIENLFGADLAKFKMTKTFSYTGGSTGVVSSSSVFVTPTITQLGSFGGWRYEGLIGNSGNWQSWGGHSKGSHWSYRQGSFRAEQYGIQLDTWYPWIRIRVYGNGSWTYTYGD